MNGPLIKKVLRGFLKLQLTCPRHFGKGILFSSLLETLTTIEDNIKDKMTMPIFAAYKRPWTMWNDISYSINMNIIFIFHHFLWYIHNPGDVKLYPFKVGHFSLTIRLIWKFIKYILSKTKHCNFQVDEKSKTKMNKDIALGHGSVGWGTYEYWYYITIQKLVHIYQV